MTSFLLRVLIERMNGPIAFFSPATLQYTSTMCDVHILVYKHRVIETENSNMNIFRSIDQ